MKTLFCLVTLWAGTGLWAGERAEPVMIQVQAHFVRATEEQMKSVSLGSPVDQHGPVIMAVAGVFTVEQTKNFLSALKAAGAEMMANPQALTLSGHRARLESVRELRYPAEFSKPSKESGEVVPIAFETKKVGIVVDFEPTLEAGETISLKCSPQVVEFMGFVDYSGVKPGPIPPDLGDYSTLLKAPLRGGGVWQPVFRSREVETTVTLFGGQTVMIAESGADPRLLIFLTADVVPEK